MHEAMMQIVCTYLNWKFSQGALDPFETCAIGKARQQNLENYHSNSSEIGECWYIYGIQLKKMQQSKGQFPTNNCFVMLIEHKTSYGIC